MRAGIRNCTKYLGGRRREGGKEGKGINQKEKKRKYIYGGICTSELGRCTHHRQIQIKTQIKPRTDLIFFPMSVGSKKTDNHSNLGFFE